MKEKYDDSHQKAYDEGYDCGFDDGAVELFCDEQCADCMMCDDCDRIKITVSDIELICEQNDYEYRCRTGGLCRTKDCRVFDLKLLVMKHERI